MTPGTPPEPAASSPPRRNGLTKGQRIGVWGGVIGTIIACSAWMITMASMAHDWMSTGVTVMVAAIAAYVFGQLCLRPGANRFALLAVAMVIMTAHCLALYWWRYEIWRPGAPVTPEAMFHEKKTLTFTLVGMVSILLVQFALFHFLHRRSKMNRAGVPVRQDN